MQYIFRGAAFTSIALSCLLAACGSSNSGGSSNTVPPTTSKTVAMTMNQAWTDTGLAVTAGQKQSISASGTFHWLTGSTCIVPGQTCSSTPDGKPWSECVNDPPPAFAAPGLPCWSLIGKIGANGTPFEVGSSLQLTDSTSGEFFLGINDNVFSDDTGAWSVAVTQL